MIDTESTPGLPIPSGWQVARLGSCLTEPPAYGIGAAAVPYDEELPVYIRITDITDDGRYSTTNRASVEYPRSGPYYLRDGDIVLARTGASVGKSYLYNAQDGPLVFAGFLIRVRPDSRRLLPAFVRAYLTTRRYWDWVRQTSMRSGQPGINGVEYAGMPIVLPPLSEQRAIAEALHDVDAACMALEQLIAKKRNLMQGVAGQLLHGSTRLPGFSANWEMRRFRDLFDFLATANNPRADLTDDGDVAYIHYGDIHTATSPILDCSRVALPRVALNKVLRVPQLRDGDLVMVDASEDTAAIGKGVEVRGIGEDRVVAGLHTILLRGRPDALADGFKAYLQFIPTVRSSLVRLAAGISVYGISKSSVGSIGFRIPAIEEQRAIAEVLTDMEAEIEAVEARLAKTRALKEAMAQELLSGRTRLI